MSIRNKDIIDLLVKAKEKGMTVFLENGKLRYTIDKNKSADIEFISDLKKYKLDITEFFKQ
ncbi:MAG: hypothetical protein IPL53_01380 [Ignavibacteria bacterium]|nr:hypothetical protein [Ignavibacteria bacterium]